MHRKVAIFLFAIIVIANSPTSCIASRSLVLDGDDATPTSNTFYTSEYAPTDDDDDSQLKEAFFPEAWGSRPMKTFDVGNNNAETQDDSHQAFLEAMGAQENTFNVIDYGAVGNGQADDSIAFLKAWGALCVSTTRGIATLVVPKSKTFLLNSVAFQGPCRSSNINFQIQGSIIAPNNIGAWKNKDKWIQFANVPGLMINGGGRIDGNGAGWWKLCGNKKSHCQRPTSLHIHKCDGFLLSRLTFLNSPKNHLSINSCNGGRVFGLLISAPKESPNTDGIDISSSTKLTIHNSLIATGDDCIAINSGSSFIKINGVKCGPGHGISIGSLGQNGEHSAVEEIQVSNCSFRGTQNGMRIKTWEGGSGYARKITFEGITFTDIENPIIIDQHYFANPTSVMDINKCVQVSDVTFRNIAGSSGVSQAITLDCGQNCCTNIIMDNVNIRSGVPNKDVYAYCNNAQGTSSFSTPYVPCLSH
ncbi:hypothetical protein TB1_006397 [Malus domestica]